MKFMLRAKSSFLLTNICLFILIFFSAVNTANSENDYDRLLKTVSKNLGGIESVKSNFKEEKYISMLKKPLTSEGFFIFQSPDKLRWEYTKPYSSGFTLNGNSGTSWDESQKIKKKYTSQSDPITSGIAKQLLLWTTFNQKGIESLYTVKLTGQRAIDLTPISESMRDTIAKINVTFSTELNSVESVTVFEKGGDYMITTFYNKTFNTENDLKIFE